MIRLIVVVEGQTEEAVVKSVLGPHLLDRGINVSATIVGKLSAHRKGHRQRGGGPYRNWKEDLRRILRGNSDPDLRVTTLFDLYGLPGDFPGLDAQRSDTNTLRRCAALEQALARSIDDRRLIPYIQRHEFEALVLAALPSLRAWLDAEDDLSGLEMLEGELGEQKPEDVNDGLSTAPSKRLLRHIPGYTKTIHGPLAVEDAGLDLLRGSCPRFADWLARLETLGGGACHE